MRLFYLLASTVFFIQNMNKTKTFILSFAVAVAFLLAAPFAFAADIGCQAVYGGGQTCVQVGNTSVTKTVKNPQTGEQVKNLGMNDAKYAPEQIVPFKVTVTNNGNAELNNITIKDTLPQYVNYFSGPGSFDANTKVLTFSIDKLGAKQSKTFDIQAQVISANQLPIQQGTICMVNQVNATTNNQTSYDNAQFCIQRQMPAAITTKGGLAVAPPTQVTVNPATGSEILPLIVLLSSALFGLKLRKKSAKTYAS